MAKEILFPEIEPRYDLQRDCLAFSARADDRPLECLVTLELLMSRFGASEPTEAAMRQAYHEHKAEIQAIARDHIENGWVDEDGRVFLTTRFTRLTVAFGDRLAQWLEGQALAANAHQVLTAIIGPNAEVVVVEWDFDESTDHPAISLRITDPSLSRPASLFLSRKVLEDRNWLRLELAGLWESILRSRSHKLFLESG